MATSWEARSFGAGSGPASVAVGDLNDDGVPDLAVANQLSNDVSVLINNTPTRRVIRRSMARPVTGGL